MTQVMMRTLGSMFLIITNILRGQCLSVKGPKELPPMLGILMVLILLITMMMVMTRKRVIDDHCAIHLLGTLKRNLGFTKEVTVIMEDQEETLENLETQMMIRMTLMTEGGVVTRNNVLDPEVLLVLHIFWMMIPIRCIMIGSVT